MGNNDTQNNDVAAAQPKSGDAKPEDQNAGAADASDEEVAPDPMQDFPIMIDDGKEGGK